VKRSGPLRASGRLVRSKPLKRGKPLKQGKGLKRGKALRSKPRTEPQYDLDLKRSFDLAVLKPAGKRAKCIVCGAPADDAHHVISKQAIKNYALGEGLSWDELQRLLWDARNGVPVCRLDHDRHENAFARIPRHALPARCWDFADALELGHRIDENYA
jgi:hypothetical protein